MERERVNYTNCNWCLATITKRLVQGLEDLEITGRVETIQSTKLLRSVRIQIRVLGTCFHSNPSDNPSGNAVVIYSQRSTNNYNNNNNNNMVLQSRRINCLKMYKISHGIIKFIEKIKESWRVELTAGVKSLAETKIQRGIFRGDAQLPPLFIIAIMTLNHILRKCTIQT